MWARVIEFAVACWLAASPFIFRHAPEERLLWINDLAGASLVALFALVSFKPTLERLHLLNALVGFWLVAAGFLFGGRPPTAGFQNEVVIGLLLLMLAIVPSRCRQPPKAWREFYQSRGDAGAGDPFKHR